MKKLQIGIFNETKQDVKPVVKTMKKVLEGASKKEGLKKVEFNVILVDNETIQTINRDYRKIDHVTDVITFALEDDKSMIVGDTHRILGDIYISLDQAKLQAQAYGHSFLREVCFLAVHGFYHLLGYDHNTKEEETIMFQKQEEVLLHYGIER